MISFRLMCPITTLSGRKNRNSYLDAETFPVSKAELLEMQQDPTTVHKIVLSRSLAMSLTQINQ